MPCAIPRTQPTHMSTRLTGCKYNAASSSPSCTPDQQAPVVLEQGTHLSDTSSRPTLPTGTEDPRYERGHHSHPRGDPFRARKSSNSPGSIVPLHSTLTGRRTFTVASNEILDLQRAHSMDCSPVKYAVCGRAREAATHDKFATAHMR